MSALIGKVIIFGASAIVTKDVPAFVLDVGVSNLSILVFPFSTLMIWVAIAVLLKLSSWKVYKEVVD